MPSSNQNLTRRIKGVLSNAAVGARARLWRSPHQPQWSDRELRPLDYRYWRMHNLHRSVHTALIAEIAQQEPKSPGPTVLEVACGTAWNAPSFIEEGFKYCGCDISETAVSLALRKFPDCAFLNLGVRDLGIVRDASFDVVYSSSMLEHIGFHELAISEMVRIARRSVYILFFEGLSDEDDHTLKFFPFSGDHIDGKEKDLFGRKIVLQEHVRTGERGYYWNRYSRRKMSTLLNDLQYDYEVMDHASREYMNGESVLHIRKGLAE